MTRGAGAPRRLFLLGFTPLFPPPTALTTGIAACFAAYFAFQAFLPSGDSMRTSLSDPGVLRAVTGGGLYLTLLGLFGLGLGAVIRSSAGAVATLFGVLFVPSLIKTLLPHSRQDTIGPNQPQQNDLHRPAANRHPRALGRVRRLQPLHGGRPRSRILPDQAPRRLAQARTMPQTLPWTPQAPPSPPARARREEPRKEKLC